MKASVVDIHKDYCIVITQDGRFIRQDTPAGSYEIGDEIVIETADLFTAMEKPLKKPFGIFARLAAGFAAIVIIGGGAYIGIKYAGPGFTPNPVKVASQAAQEKTTASPGQEGADGGNATLGQDEQALAAAAQPSESSADTAQSGQSSSSSSNQDSSGAAVSDTNDEKVLTPAPLPLLLEGAFKLEKNNIDILIDYQDLLITYKLWQSYGQDSGTGEIGIFTLKIKNIQKSTFTGNIDIIFIDKNSGILQTSAFEAGNMGFNDDYTEQIQVAADADSFIMALYGSFNES
jgi:hypothetical protein